MVDTLPLASEIKDLKIAFNALRERLHSLRGKLSDNQRELSALKAEVDSLRILLGKRLISAETFSLITSRVESRLAAMEVLKCLSESL